MNRYHVLIPPDNLRLQKSVRLTCAVPGAAAFDMASHAREACERTEHIVLEKLASLREELAVFCTTQAAGSNLRFLWDQLIVKQKY